METENSLTHCSNWFVYWTHLCCKKTFPCFSDDVIYMRRMYNNILCWYCIQLPKSLKSWSPCCFHKNTLSKFSKLLQRDRFEIIRVSSLCPKCVGIWNYCSMNYVLLLKCGYDTIILILLFIHAIFILWHEHDCIVALLLHCIWMNWIASTGAFILLSVFIATVRCNDFLRAFWRFFFSC